MDTIKPMDKYSILMIDNKHKPEIHIRRFIRSCTPIMPNHSHAANTVTIAINHSSVLVSNNKMPNNTKGINIAAVINLCLIIVTIF